MYLLALARTDLGRKSPVRALHTTTAALSPMQSINTVTVTPELLRLQPCGNDIRTVLRHAYPHPRDMAILIPLWRYYRANTQPEVAQQVVERIGWLTAGGSQDALQLFDGSPTVTPSNASIITGAPCIISHRWSAWLKDVGLCELTGTPLRTDTPR